MDEWEPGTWIALGAFLSTILLAAFAFLLPSNRIRELRATIESLREEVRDLRDQVARLEAQLAQKYDENQWLMRQLRRAEDREVRRNEEEDRKRSSG